MCPGPMISPIIIIRNSKILPHAQNRRALGEHYARTFNFVRAGLVKKFWAAKLGCRSSSWGSTGAFGSPSWRISGSAPQAELGAKRSTTRLRYARYAVISTNKAWEG